MKQETYKKLYEELAKYENSGISMRLDDNLASPMQIVSAHMVREETAYMRDYVWDERGHVREVTFHNILES